MLNPQPLTLALPLELVESIVDNAGPESTQTCLLLSRHFHAGALRYIYRNYSITLTAPNGSLEKQFNRLFGSQDGLSLVGGDRGRHVRNLSIEGGALPMLWDGNDPTFHEDILIRILVAFSEHKGLQKLAVTGGSGVRQLEWTDLPARVGACLQRLIRSPNLSSIHIRRLHKFPVDVLHGQQNLSSVEVTRCCDVTNASRQVVVVPNAERMFSYHLGPTSNMFLLPRLQNLTAHHRTLAERDDSWTRMDHARQTLKNLSLTDNDNGDFSAPLDNNLTPALPEAFKLDNFPELCHLHYAFEGSSHNTSFVLQSILPFFEGTSPNPSLSQLRILLRLDQPGAAALGEDVWMARIPLLTGDQSWAALDTILASDRYPLLTEVAIEMEIFNALLEKLDPETIWEAYPQQISPKPDLEKEIRDFILSQFAGLTARGIEVDVLVKSNF